MSPTHTYTPHTVRDEYRTACVTVQAAEIHNLLERSAVSTRAPKRMEVQLCYFGRDKQNLKVTMEPFIIQASKKKRHAFLHTPSH